MKKINNYINGKLSISSSKRFSPVYDPSTGEVQAEVVLSNKDDFDQMIENSENSFLEWSKVTPLNRSRVLSKYKTLLENFYNQ